MSNATISVLIIIIIVYVYTLQYAPTGNHKVFLDDIQHGFKTGDIILFKAYNNFNSLKHTSYYGHVGIVYVGDDGIPMLFEANGIDHMPLMEHHDKTGMFFTPLIDRIKKYKGIICWKILSEPIDAETECDFRYFIDYCMNNMKYDMGIKSSALKKYLGISRCNLGTNCGELVFLSLIKLGLISPDEYDVPRLHYLKYIVNIKHLQNGYRYLDPLEIIDHPFAE